MITITNNQQLKQLLTDHFIVITVFSTRTCGVCSPLKEKIKALIEPFDQVKLCEVYIEDTPKLKGDYQVFTAPITLLFVDGKEVSRQGAAINLNDLKSSISRYYAFL